MGGAFKDFLATEHNLDAWNFLQAIKTLETVTDEKDKIKKTRHIMSNFIEPNSKEEINISGELRNHVLAAFKKQEENAKEWVLEVSPTELFSECFKLIVSLLTHDPFKRFVRTTECENVMKQYQRDSTVISPVITQTFGFDDSYFTNPHFRDLDIDFFLSLFKDSYHWELIGSKITENTNAYISKTNFFPDVSIVKKLKLSKFESFLPCTFDQALLSYFDNDQLYKADPNCGKYETVQYFSYEELLEHHKNTKTSGDIQKYKRDTAISRIELKLPFPLDPRVANYAMTCYYDPVEEVFMRIGKTFLKEGKWDGSTKVEEVTLKRGAKPTKKKVHTLFLFSAGLYKKLDNKRVFYQEINFNNFSGWASSNAMSRVIIKERKDKFRNQMLDLAKDIPENAKIMSLKDELFRLIDGKMNGLGNILYNTIQLNKPEIKDEKRSSTFTEED
eukprot:gene4520-7898_t